MDPAAAVCADVRPGSATDLPALSAFARGCTALEDWSMFRVGFAELCWPQVRPEPGAVVGVLATLAGVWSLNCARVLFAFDEPGPIHRFGFAYGTLPDHVAVGDIVVLKTGEVLVPSGMPIPETAALEIAASDLAERRTRGCGVECRGG